MNSILSSPRLQHESNLRQKCPGSISRYERACRSLAGGVSSGLRRAAKPFPLYFAGGSGAASSAINSVPSYYMNCSSTATPGGTPVSLTGNVLLSQCGLAGTYVGPPSSDSYSATGSRGLLFFSAHANTYNATLIGAGASLNFSGTLYFHNTSYADQVELDGAGGSTTYAVGSIVVDQLTLSGSGTISMNVNSTAASGVPEVSLFQ